MLALAEEVDGFTEPYRTVNVAAPDIGIVASIAVREGEAVVPQQVLASLDDELHRVQLAIAKAQQEARGELNAGLAELALKRDRLEKLQSLLPSGHVRQEEVDRAAAEVDVAGAKVVSLREQLAIKTLESEKFAAQLERRKIRSPISGVVSRIHRQPGEMVAPNNPDIVTIVQIEPLLAVFSVTGERAKRLRVEQAVSVRLADGKHLSGNIDTLAPIVNAESGTVRIKVRLPNVDRAILSGERCTLLLE
jgi:RND family efflux transporter MFP subunit